MFNIAFLAVYSQPKKRVVAKLQHKLWGGVVQFCDVAKAVISSIERFSQIWLNMNVNILKLVIPDIRIQLLVTT
jgi:hypothetical protein